jgi:hypothetical protein
VYPGLAQPGRKSFLLLFFKKEDLAFLVRSGRCRRLRRLLLGSGSSLGILLVLLGGFVVSDDAAGRGTEGGMVAGNMAGNAANNRALDAAGLCGERRACDGCCDRGIPDEAHCHILVIIDATGAVFVVKASGGLAGSWAPPIFSMLFLALG